MATQQVLFAETIAGMKKAFRRKAYESDSDSEVESYGNRGHKLQKRARFARRGQLVPPEGPSAYREVVDYAGARRSIIHRNPPLVDENGYEIDSDDDDDRIEDALASASELNPYSNIRLEHVLAPLTASTDLPSHPTLSKPFTSQNLTNLSLQSSLMMRKENQSLWQVRHLWTALCGDRTWAPCGTMLGPNDIELYTDDHVARHLLSLSKASTATSPATANGEGLSKQAPSGDDTKGLGNQNQTSHGDTDMPMTDVGQADPQVNAENDSKGQDTEALVNGNNSAQGLGTDKGTSGNGTKTQQDGELTLARRPGNMTPSVEAQDRSFIHPMFIPPTGALSDQNCGLPDQEAEDIRRLLALFVQKQEEVCRGVNRLHDGLTKAHRLRQEVLNWSKAEAHCGVNRDMSDGEDWYDMEEWGLSEDLKKGQDDEEEDTTTTGKKTRARR